MTTKQLELNHVSRKRAVILPDEPAAVSGVVVGDEYLDGIMKRTPRREFGAALDDAGHDIVGKFGAAATERLIDYTDWKSGPPPCTGYWDVSPKLHDMSAVRPIDIDRLWYISPEHRREAGVNTTSGSVRLPSGMFVDWTSLPLVWRGLRSPWPAGYPYDVVGAGFTLHARIKAETGERKRERKAINPDDL